MNKKKAIILVISLMFLFYPIISVYSNTKITNNIYILAEETEEEGFNTPATCKGIISDDLHKELEAIFNLFKIIAPILVLVLSSFDFLTGVLSQEDEQMKKATSKLIKRLILAAVLFVLPIILNMLLGLMDWGTDPTCGIR